MKNNLLIVREDEESRIAEELLMRFKIDTEKIVVKEYDTSSSLLRLPCLLVRAEGRTNDKMFKGLAGIKVFIKECR